MEWLAQAIAVDGGFKLGVALILLIKYFETKEKAILWWSIGWFFFFLHNILELILVETNGDIFHFFAYCVYAFTAVAFLISIEKLQKKTHRLFSIFYLRFSIWSLMAISLSLMAIVTAFLGVYVIKEWFWGAFPSSLINGGGFLISAYFIYRLEKHKKSVSTLLIFYGFLLNGIHNLDYSFLRPVTWFAPIGFGLGVVLSLIFAAGFIVKSTEELRRQREKSKKIAQDLSVLNSVSSVVLQSLDLDRILNETLDETLKALGTDRGGIYLVDEQKNELLFYSHRGFSSEFIRGVESLKFGEGFAGYVVKTNEPYFVEDVSKEQRSTTLLIEKEGFQSFAMIPLKSEDKILGALNIVYHGYHKFTIREKDLLLAIANQLGIAIKNAKLFKQSKQREEDLSYIYETSRIFSSTLEFKNVLHNIVRRTVQAFNVDSCLLRLVELDKLVVKASFSRYSKDEEELDRLLAENLIKIGKGIAGKVIKTGQPCISDETPVEKLTLPGYVKYLKKRHWLVVPMKVKDKNIGVLTLMTSDLTRAFSKRDLSLAQGIANQAAVAIENARLYEEIKGAYKNLQAFQDQVIQSEKIRALGEMAGGVAHDFNNLLAAILGRTQLLLENTSEVESRKWLKIIEQAALDGAETIRKILEFSRTYKNKTFVILELNKLVEDAIEITRPYWKDKSEAKGIKIDLSSELDMTLPIEGNAAELREVITNLIINAVDAMPEGGTLNLSTKVKEAWVFLSVKDSGSGMSEEASNNIFEPFFTTKGVGHTGLGMSTCNGIIKRHQGDIIVNVREGQGTEIIVKIPVSVRSENRKEPSKFRIPFKSAKILIIDDDKEVRDVLRDILAIAGYDIHTSPTGKEGLLAFNEIDFDLVFTDLGMPDMNGWEIANSINKINSKIPVILITGWGDQFGKEHLKKSGIDLIVSKPFDRENLLKIIKQSLKSRK